MEILLIDIPFLPSIILNNKNFKAFFTLLGFVKKVKKMATNLINKLFNNFFITIGNVLLNHINSVNAACDTIDTNIFAHIASNWYLSNKFYEIMINTNASNHFIAAYGQFITYKRDIKYMIIDISKVDAIHIQFSIGLIFFIRFVLI